MTNTNKMSDKELQSSLNKAKQQSELQQERRSELWAARHAADEALKQVIAASTCWSALHNKYSEGEDTWTKEDDTICMNLLNMDDAISELCKIHIKKREHAEKLQEKFEKDFPHNCSGCGSDKREAGGDD